LQRNLRQRAPTSYVFDDKFGRVIS
jgi:hypothetical protein